MTGVSLVRCGGCRVAKLFRWVRWPGGFKLAKRLVRIIWFCLEVLTGMQDVGFYFVETMHSIILILMFNFIVH